MTNPLPPDAHLKKLPCDALRAIINQRDRNLKVMIGLSALALGFSVFIAAQAPIRQASIISNQSHTLLTLEQNRQALIEVADKLRHLAAEEEEHGECRR